MQKQKLAIGTKMYLLNLYKFLYFLTIVIYICLFMAYNYCLLFYMDETAPAILSVMGFFGGIFFWTVFCGLSLNLLNFIFKKLGVETTEFSS